MLIHCGIQVLFYACVCLVCSHVFFVFFFKQKTAYEMRISDWSSDVCSSDLNHGFCGNAELLEEFPGRGRGAEAAHADEGTAGLDPALPPERDRKSVV